MKGLTPICPYCKTFSKLVTGKDIYPNRNDLKNIQIYQCKPCAAYVGCHGLSDKPLGRLANAELRRAKSAAHRAFDPIWKNKHMKRPQAYKWLAEQLKISGGDCHIGMFNLETCKEVERLSINFEVTE